MLGDTKTICPLHVTVRKNVSNKRKSASVKLLTPRAWRGSFDFPNTLNGKENSIFILQFNVHAHFRFITVVYSHSMGRKAKHSSFIYTARWLCNMRHHCGQFLYRVVEFVSTIFFRFVSCFPAIITVTKTKKVFNKFLQLNTCEATVKMTALARCADKQAQFFLTGNQMIFTNFLFSP